MQKILNKNNRMVVGKFRWILNFVSVSMFFFSLNVHAKSPEVNFDAKLYAFAQKIVTVINKRDVEQFKVLFDFNEFAKRAAINALDNKMQQKQFMKGVIAGQERFAQRYMQNFASTEGGAKFIKLMKRYDHDVVLIRYNLGDIGYDYAEYVVQRQPDQNYKAIDIYQLSTGQLLTVSLGSLAKLWQDPDQALLEKLFGLHKLDGDLLKQLELMNGYARQENYEQALQVFNRMPEKVRNARIMITVGLSYATRLADDANYKMLLSKLARYHSKDPASAFILIDHYLYEGNLEKAFEAIDVVENRYGQDALFEMMRATLYLSINDLDKHMRHIKKSITLEPDFEDAYFSLSLGYIQSEKYQDAITVYNKLASDFGYQFNADNFNADPAFSKFVTSTEFQRWQGIKQSN